MSCANCVAAAGANATTLSTINGLIMSTHVYFDRKVCSLIFLFLFLSTLLGINSQCASAGETISGTSALPSVTGATSAAPAPTTTSGASKIAMGAFGVVITSVVGAIALL